jgi:hypothetical protein
MLYGAAIAWSSRQQRAVALSTAEAEYVALAETGRDVVWIRRLLSDLNVAPTAPTLLHEDNAAALKWTVEARNWNRSRHIDTAFHKIREWIDDKLIAVQKVDSANQLADLFTKALKPVDHARLASLILGSADVCAADNVRRNIFSLSLPSLSVRRSSPAPTSSLLLHILDLRSGVCILLLDSLTFAHCL